MRCTTEIAGRARNRSTSFTRSHGEAGTWGAELRGTSHVTGDTPLHMPGWYQENWRVKRDFHGVPGHTFDNPVCLATPERHTKRQPAF